MLAQRREISERAMSENRITDFNAQGENRWPFKVSMPEFQAQNPVTQAAATRDLYAVAWTLSQRDYELDKLFNAAYYYEI
jgi:hypothetical protein